MPNPLQEIFDAVHAAESTKQNTKAFLADYRARVTPKPRVRYKQALAIAGMAVTMLVFGGTSAYATPTTVVSVEGQSLVELQLNLLGRVIAVHTADTAAGDTGNLLNCSYEDAVEILLSAEPEDPDTPVSVTISDNNTEKSREMETTLAESQSDAHTVLYQCMGRQEANQARAAGLSLGKYQAYLELQQLDPSVTTEEVQDMTMRQLREQIASLDGTASASSRPNHGANHGNAQNTQSGGAMGNASSASQTNGHKNNAASGKQHAEAADPNSTPESGSQTEGTASGAGNHSNNGNHYGTAGNKPAKEEQKPSGNGSQTEDTSSGASNDSNNGSNSNNGGNRNNGNHGGNNGNNGNHYGTAGNKPAKEEQKPSGNGSQTEDTSSGTSGNSNNGSNGSNGSNGNHYGNSGTKPSKDKNPSKKNPAAEAPLSKTPAAVESI